jgi:hypothetical protein
MRATDTARLVAAPPAKCKKDRTLRRRFRLFAQEKFATVFSSSCWLMKIAVGLLVMMLLSLSMKSSSSRSLLVRDTGRGCETVDLGRA